MEDTNPSGSEPLNVNTAASAFLGLMGDDGESDDGQLAAESRLKKLMLPKHLMTLKWNTLKTMRMWRKLMMLNLNPSGLR